MNNRVIDQNSSIDTFDQFNKNQKNIQNSQFISASNFNEELQTENSNRILITDYSNQNQNEKKSYVGREKENLNPYNEDYTYHNTPNNKLKRSKSGNYLNKNINSRK